MWLIGYIIAVVLLFALIIGSKTKLSAEVILSIFTTALLSWIIVMILIIVSIFCLQDYLEDWIYKKFNK